jgi:hypothetical protein
MSTIFPYFYSGGGIGSTTYLNKVNFSSDFHKKLPATSYEVGAIDGRLDDYGDRHTPSTEVLAATTWKHHNRCYGDASTQEVV